ncbi:MAG: isoprenyl transferase [Eubacterium sp.]|nr:isoprenyl transferase [Eubacterium sp.]
MEETLKIPAHVAIILDGNGRWAKSKGLPRNVGHTQGARNIETICRAAHSLGIKYLTYYAFSTENWNRPKDEVNKLMELLRDYMKTAVKRANKNNMRVRIIGDINRLDDDLIESIRNLEEASKDNTGLNMQIAINYGSRDEIVRAVNRFIDEKGAAHITEEELSAHLDTADIPDPDLLIRTSGEQRLSNYLLWQLAYAEFYFTRVPWPAFSEKDLKEAVAAYSSRDRRFGMIKES